MTLFKNEKDDENSDEEDIQINRDNNHVFFYSEIDRNAIFKLLGAIREAEEYCVLNSYKLRVDIPIYLHINSNGGTISDAFAAIDAILSCRVPVYSIIEGATASAGTLISVVCKKRYICPNAYMLIHELRSEVWGKMSEIEEEYKNLKKTMRHIIKIYTAHSNLSKSELKEMLRGDLWMNAKTCLEYRLVDELWSNSAQFRLRSDNDAPNGASTAIPLAVGQRCP
jgi:ATP-dependent Clp protease protease subunit